MLHFLLNRKLLNKYCTKKIFSVYLYCTTFMSEPGQNRKIAALRSSKCVCFFCIEVKIVENFMELAYKESLKALKNDDVPVGAVIVKDNKVIARAYNSKEKNKNATNHAEIIAINKACGKLNSWHLNDCEMYVTMEPCIMCTGAIIQARIPKIFYIVENSKFGVTNMLNKSEFVEKFNHKISVKKVNDIYNYTEELIKFFKNKR